MKTEDRFRLLCDARAATPAGMVGAFDSGVGGLAVVRELINLSAPFAIRYVADQRNAPYGEKTLGQIRSHAESISQFLVDHGARIIVVACNSASAAALYHLRQVWPKIAFVGMEPAVKPAVEFSRRRRIGVVATAATLAGQPFRQVIEKYAAGHIVIERACPELVGLVESGRLWEAEAQAVVAKALAPVLAEDIDHLVLGCTHFSFLNQLVQEVVGPAVRVVDPSLAVARQTLRVAAAAGVANTGGETGETSCELITTGEAKRFARTAERLLGRRFPVHAASWSEAEG